MSKGSRAAVQRCLQSALQRPANIASLPPAEIDFTLRVTRRARLLGRLAADIGRADALAQLPRVAIDQLQSAMISTAARARVARWELDRIERALAHLPDVPIVVLKGMGYLLAGTPNAAGRSFNDVDLMVPELQLGEVEKALRAAGWATKELDEYDELYYRLWTHELPPLSHDERGVEVDLHHSILMRTARLKPSSALLFSAARDMPGSRFKVLAPLDMVLHSVVHLFYGGEMDDALRELVDIDDLLRHFAAIEPGFWEQFWPRAKALDLERPAFYALRYARELLGTPVPASVVSASMAGGPSALVLTLMDRLVPRALFPQHPDAPSRLTEWARLLLYVRSHWVKMPPLMLVRHLSYKFYVQRFKRSAEEAAGVGA